MLFNDTVVVHQTIKGFDHGETSTVYTPEGDMWCHLQNTTAKEGMSADRKQESENLTMTYVPNVYTLVFRTVIQYGSKFYRLLHDPVEIKGMSKTYYQVDITRDYNVEVVDNS